jgi:hypothetical protein
MGNLGENVLGLLVGNHVGDIYQWAADCKFNSYKYTMNYMATLGGLQVNNLFMA